MTIQILFQMPPMQTWQVVCNKNYFYTHLMHQSGQGKRSIWLFYFMHQMNSTPQSTWFSFLRMIAFLNDCLMIDPLDCCIDWMNQSSDCCIDWMNQSLDCCIDWMNQSLDCCIDWMNHSLDCCIDWMNQSIIGLLNWLNDQSFDWPMEGWSDPGEWNCGDWKLCRRWDDARQEPRQELHENKQ